MWKSPSQYNRSRTTGLLILMAGVVLLLTAALPGRILLDGGGFPTPTPTDAPALAPEPAPTETPTLVPVELVIPDASPTPVILLGVDQQSAGPDNIIANPELVEEQSEGGFNFLLLGIPILGVLAVLAVVVGFYLRRGQEAG